MKIIFKHLCILLFLGLIPSGCDEGPVNTPPISDGLTISYPETYVEGIATIVSENHEESYGEDDGEDHGDVILGFQIEEEGQENFIYRELNLTPQGSISIGVGETKEFALHFLDENGDEIVHEEEEEDPSNEEDHGTHIIITGDAVGTTYFQIKLMHDGHSDFTSLGDGIPVDVTE